MPKTPEELIQLSERANALVAEYLVSEEYLRTGGSINLHGILYRPENDDLREATRGLVFVFDRDKKVQVVNDYESFKALARLEQKGPYKIVGGAFAEGEPDFADLLS